MSERSATAGSAANVSEELAALLQERERYELWLRQLEGKKDSTPNQVYVRVHADYSGRLKEVLDRVAGRTGELRSQIESLEARLAIVEREVGELREERAEAELRHTVGEYSEDQWKEISAHTEEALTRVTAQRTEVAADIARLREMLVAATGSDPGAGERGTPAEQPDEDAGEPTPEMSTKEAEPEPQPAAQRVSAAVPARASGAATPIADEPARISRSVEMPAQAAESSPPEPAPVAEVAPPAPPAEKPKESAAPPVATTQSAQPAQPPRTTPSAGRRTSGFDDLAFVSSLVTPEDRRTPVVPTPVIPVGPPADAAPKAERAAPRLSGPETPSSFMKGVRGEAVKSLKCQECGTLNYPTEWYCERCGGELAAL